MQRSFYVGGSITEEDIKAKYENGVLSLLIPKKEAKKEPEKKTILIGICSVDGDSKNPFSQ